MAITSRGLRTLAPGHWLAEGNRGEGQLRAKGSRSGAYFYFRYRKTDGKTDDLPIGRFDEYGKTGLRLQDAERISGELRRRYLDGERDLRTALKADWAEAQRQRELEQAKAKAAEVAAAERRTRTLGALLEAYVKHLEHDGKSSAKDVERGLTRLVKEPWPQYWNAPLDEITVDDLLSIIAAQVKKRHLRQADILRSYLRAAYSTAIRARTEPGALPALRDLHVVSNLARDLSTIKGSHNVRDRSLSIAELRAYWGKIQGDSVGDAVLRFHLLTGGQRLKQLQRASRSGLDMDSSTFCLHDPKGRREVPRIHVIPLIPAALDAMEVMRSGQEGEFLFTLDCGESGASYYAVYDLIQNKASDMLKAGEMEGDPFTPGDLRRTVETRLSGLRISKEVRGQLQSHGLGGVQNRHYDRYDYLKEKREALVALHDLLTDGKRKARANPPSTGTRLRKRNRDAPSR